MFDTHSPFKVVTAILAAASIAAAGARAATAGTPYDPNAYVPGGASPAVCQAIQSAGFGSTRSPSSARRENAVRPQGLRIITDTLGGTGTPLFRLHGGRSLVL